jgi:sulfite reductase alpha subunit-like flavoprotein
VSSAVYQLRDFRQIVLEPEGAETLEYEVGDALDVYPANDPASIAELLHALNMEPSEVVEVGSLCVLRLAGRGEGRTRGRPAVSEGGS